MEAVKQALFDSTLEVVRCFSFCARLFYVTVSLRFTINGRSSCLRSSFLALTGRLTGERVSEMTAVLLCRVGVRNVNSIVHSISHNRTLIAITLPVTCDQSASMPGSAAN